MQRAYRPFKNRVSIISNLSLRLIENIFPIRLNNILIFVCFTTECPKFRRIETNYGHEEKKKNKYNNKNIKIVHEYKFDIKKTL